MKWKIVYLQSDKSAIIKEVSHGSDHDRNQNTDQGNEKAFEKVLKTLSISNLREEHPHLLLYSPEVPLEEFRNFFNEESRHYAIFPAEKLFHDANEFEALDEKEAGKIFSDFYGKWILSNNVQTVEEIFRLADHLKKLWKDDYNTFFEEMWFVLKRNLGAFGLKIIFHDLLENDKDKLIHAVIQGERFPQTLQGGDAEKRLMEAYPPSPHQPLQLIEYSSEKGRLVLSAQMRQGPFLIMGEVFSLNKLQWSILNALFEGINLGN